MRLLRYVVALALITAACSGDVAETTTTTTLPTTTTTEATTTTTEPPTTTTIDDRPRSPINGLPIDDPASLERRVVAVKIDNHWNARPQSGIRDADGVFEIRVEGGLTRFMAVFHSSDSEMLGPIRSGRPSDAAIVRPLEAVLVISGGQPWVQAGIRNIGVDLIGDTRPAMFRISGRSAPHNLYGSTLLLRETADDREIPDEAPPTSLWEFGEELPADAEEASHAAFTFSDTLTAEWSWDGSAYYRTLEGSDSNWINADEETERISADVLIAIVGEQYTASPPSGAGGSSVPATSTLGSGPVHIFAGGKTVSGTWERENPEDPFVFTTEAGEPLLIPAGWPWISIVPDNGEVAWDNPPVTTTTTAPTTSTTSG